MAIIPNTGEGAKWACDKCGECFDSIFNAERHKCSGDNRGNPELLFEQQAAVDSMLDEITASENALNALVDLYSEAKSRISGHLAKNLKQAFAETKKSAGIDQLMLWAGAQTPELQKDYETYIELSKKATIHTAILESKGKRLYGVMHKNKINDWKDH